MHIAWRDFAKSLCRSSKIGAKRAAASSPVVASRQGARRGLTLAFNAGTVQCTYATVMRTTQATHYIGRAGDQDVTPGKPDKRQFAVNYPGDPATV